MIVTREAAAKARLRSQRERLLAACVEVVAERGYEAARVEDLLTASGVPRTAFYKIFSNKEECFLAAVDQLVELAGPAVLDVYVKTPGSWERRMRAMLDALAALIAAHPDAARIAWIESYAAGDEAVRRIDRIDARTERIVRSALAESRAHAGLPPESVRALIGGLRKMIHTRLREGREADLQDEMPEIFDWMLRYRTPPRRLRRPRRPPDCLVPETPAFLATIDLALQRAIAAVMPVYRAAPDSPHAVAGGLHAFCALFSSDAALSRLGAYESSGGGMTRLDQSISRAQSLLQPGFELHPDSPPIAGEAIGASIYSLMSRQIRRRGPEHLYEVAPTAAFIALAPFVGSAEAARVANAVPAE